MSDLPNSYDRSQNSSLGDPNGTNTKLALGSGAFQPVIGDALYFSEEGANPRWLNLTKLLGALAFSVQTGLPYRRAHNLWSRLEPTNLLNGGAGPANPCVLNPDVTWQMTQTPALGSLTSVDGFDWVCNIDFSMTWDLVVTGTNTLASNSITTKVFVNGVENNDLVGYNQTELVVGGNKTDIRGWLRVNAGDTIDIRQFNNDNATGNVTETRVTLFNFNCVAQRLLT